MSSFEHLRRACLLAAALALAGVVAAPAASAAPAPSCVVHDPQAPGAQSLRICAGFDATAYKSNQPITLTITVTNLGTQTAPGVYVLQPSGISFRMLQDVFTGVDPAFTDQNTGIDIAPGATVTATGIGYAADASSGTVEATELILERDEDGGIEPIVSASVTPVSGGYSGLVYTAQPTATGAPGPHVGLAGVGVSVFDPIIGRSASTVTDASGHFTFINLPGGPYEVSFDTSANQDWVVQAALPVVNVGGSPSFELHPQYLARPPEFTVLASDATFDQRSYALGDTATISVTLTNLTGRPLSGIHAFCVDPIGSGWAPFTSASGAVVPPGDTVFHVSQPITTTGSAELSCAFGLLDVSGNPFVFDSVPVTG